PSRSGGADHRFRRRRRTRWPFGRRADARRRYRDSPRAGHGRHRRDDPRDPGRGDVSRRHQARHRPQSDPLKEHAMKPGEILTAKGELELNAQKNRHPITVEVANTGDRPIQVGSHYHFFETNDALKFDRKRAKGMRLDIAAGTAVRFEPGQSRTVRLTPYMGARQAHGFQGKVSGKLGPIAKVGPSNEGPARISRSAYVHMFGPTTGDKVRLADTDLFIEVEKDHTTYGEEVKFGGGK